jgi:hypothetical protein
MADSGSWFDSWWGSSSPAESYGPTAPADDSKYWGELGRYGQSQAPVATQPTTQAPAEKSWYQDPSLLSGLIGAGTGLAGIYFQQQGAKEMAADAIKQRQAEMEAARLAALQKGGGGGGGGARTAALAAMYNNYASLMQRSGESLQQGALETGRNAAAPILTRSGK